MTDSRSTLDDEAGDEPAGELRNRIAELENQVAYLMRYFRDHAHPPGAGASVPPYR